MGVHPTKPRYTCDNCLFDKKPGYTPCSACPVTEKATDKPQRGQPLVDLSKWGPTATKEQK